MAKVLAVTTSMGTRWEAYSQALLKTTVPEWGRLVVDGRKEWSPTHFIESVIDKEVDYVVHVDEDCFVESRDALLDLIQYFEENIDCVAAGIPDGGHYYRDHNPAALNLFFVLFRADALKKAWADKQNWQQLYFREEFKKEFLSQCESFDSDRIQWDEAEPYYPLFWSLLNSGGKFFYLHQNLLTQRWSTQVCLPSGDVLAEHMWYLRQWFSDDVMPGHDCSNRQRYERFRDELFKTSGSSVRFKLVHLWMNARRFTRRFASSFSN